MTYIANRDAHHHLTAALAALDGAEESYCPLDCDTTTCDGHEPAPDGLVQAVAEARALVKASMCSTLAALLADDPLPARVRDDR